MLLFGKNNVRIASYTPYELGVSNNPDSGFKIEIRQHYLHVLQLPIIAVGKTWHIRKGAQLDKMPEQYKRQINKKKVRADTPLHTCTGAILLLLVIGCYFLYQEKEKQRKRAIFEVVEPARVAI